MTKLTLGISIPLANKSVVNKILEIPSLNFCKTEFRSSDVIKEFKTSILKLFYNNFFSIDCNFKIVLQYIIACDDDTKLYKSNNVSNFSFSDSTSI